MIGVDCDRPIGCALRVCAVYALLASADRPGAATLPDWVKDRNPVDPNPVCVGAFLSAG